MSVYSTSGSKRMSLHAPPGTPTKPFTQRIKGQRCLRTRPRRSRGYPGTRSRHNDESALPALPMAATPALMTSLFKRMSLYSPAGILPNPVWQRIHGQRCLRTRPRCSRGYPGARSRHTDESVLAAPLRAVTPAHSTSVFKSMSLHLPAGPAPGTVAAAPASKRARGAAPRRLEPRRGSGAVRGPQRGAPAGHLQGTERIRAAQASPVFHRFPRKRPARRWARRVGRRRWPRCPRPRHRLARSTATNGLAVDSLMGLARAIETVVDVSQSMTLRKASPLAGRPRARAPEDHGAERGVRGWPSTRSQSHA